MPEPTPESLRKALERTAMAREFTAEALRQQLERTATDEELENTPQQYLQRTGSDKSGTADARLSTASATITSFGGSESVPEQLRETPSAPSQRYQILGEVGRGATSRVYALHDNSLDRTVAVKFLNTRKGSKEAIRQHFLHEARITAALQHPNIMPVYDIGVTGDERLFLSMKKIEGCSLGEAIRALKDGKDAPEEVRTLDGRVRVFLKICDALTYAHHRGYVHQDIKPDNIMLGQFGEVLLLDWGSAIRAEDSDTKGVEKHLYGTPAYMSPEQARREHADERSDVYCLGATFFHALLLRHPVWAESPEEFWQRKRSGALDRVTEEESRRVPKALVNIALKALQPEVSRRYQSVTEFADDLKRYQAGLAVSAYRESPLEAFRRWYHTHEQIFWISTTLTAIVVAVASLLLREKIQELVTWRKFYVDTFDYPATAGLSANWKSVGARDWYNMSPATFGDSSAWRVDGAALVGTNGEGFSNIAFSHVIPGDIRVEWDVTGLAQSGNLNCFIAGDNRFGGYTFHVGAFNDRASIKLSRMWSGIIDDGVMSEALQSGRTYRFRMEKESRTVRLFVDGEKVMEYRDADDLQGAGHQTFGFECNNSNRIRIDNVRVLYHPLPLKVSPLAAADQFYELGYYRDALTKYRELADAYAGKDVARFALYKAGRCLVRLDSADAALGLFASFEHQFPHHELMPFVYRERARVYESRGDTAGAENCYRDLAVRFEGHPILRSAFQEMTTVRAQHLNRLLTSWIGDSASDQPAPKWILDESLRIQQLGRAFGLSVARNEFIARSAGALASKHLLAAADIVERYPEQREEQAVALIREGQFERVADAYQDLPGHCGQALQELGEYGMAMRIKGLSRDRMAKLLLAAGRLQQVVDFFAEYSSEACSALIGLGRFDEAMLKYPGIDLLTPVMRKLGCAEKVMAVLAADDPARARIWVQVLNKPDSAHAVFQSRAPQTTSASVIDAWSYLYHGQPMEAFRRFNRTVGLEELCAEALRRQGLVEQSLALYPNYTPIIALALRERGELDAVQRRCPNGLVEQVDALFLMGRKSDIERNFPRRKPVIAKSALWAGEYERVLREFPDERVACATALYLSGRGAEIAARFPEQRDLCAAFLYSAGRADEALERYPESREDYARMLLDKKDYTQVVERFADQTLQYAWALLETGQDTLIPFERGFALLSTGQAAGVRSMMALREWDRGEHRRADSLLASARRGYADMADHPARFSRQLLGPILHALDGDTATLQHACRTISDSLMYRYSQTLWYEAGWLSGRLSDQQFLAQPVGLDAADRLDLLKAIRADIDGRVQDALPGYERALARGELCRWLPTPSSLGVLLTDQTVMRFAQRRIAALNP